MTKLTQSQQELLGKVRVLNTTTLGAYNRAWRADPGPRGYPAVDKALGKLERVERMQALAERGELSQEAFADL
jgi:hypothetical protein